MLIYYMTEEDKQEIISGLEEYRVQDWKRRYEVAFDEYPLYWRYGMEFMDGTVISSRGDAIVETLTEVSNLLSNYDVFAVPYEGEE